MCQIYRSITLYITELHVTGQYTVLATEEKMTAIKWPVSLRKPQQTGRHTDMESTFFLGIKSNNGR